jgi:hypothetical protein
VIGYPPRGLAESLFDNMTSLLGPGPLCQSKGYLSHSGGRQSLGNSLVRETSMTLIWLGVLLVFGGVLQMAYQPIWQADSAIERDFARDPLTPWNLKDRRVALGSNRIGLELRWSRLAPLSCWPGLPSKFETDFGNSLGTFRAISAGFGARAISLAGTNAKCRLLRAMSAF